MNSRSLAVRLMLGGLPALISAGVAATVPLTGALFLSQHEYAIWALVTTLSTIFLLFDFGAPALATKLAAEGSLGRQAIIGVLALTSVPPLLLGGVAAVIWQPYARISQLSAFEPRVVVLAVVLVAVGCALRSASSVFAAISLGRAHYGRRASILIGGALSSAVVTLGSLWSGAGLMSLGLGVIANGAVGMALALILERRLDISPTDLAVARLIRLFFMSKGAATLLGLVITQLDRWALGLAGDATLLAAYDLSTRIIQIPKIALLALLVGLVAESAAAQGRDLKHLWSRSTRMAATVFALSQIACIPLALIFMNENSAIEYWPLVIGVAAAQFTLTATIPTTLILAGEGRPQKELLYLVPTFVLVMIGYGLGVGLRDGMLLLTIWLGSVALSSACYVSYGPRLIGVRDAI